MKRQSQVGTGASDPPQNQDPHRTNSTVPFRACRQWDRAVDPRAHAESRSPRRAIPKESGNDGSWWLCCRVVSAEQDSPARDKPCNDVCSLGNCSCSRKRGVIISRVNPVLSINSRAGRVLARTRKLPRSRPGHCCCYWECEISAW